ncbi:MAG: dicarboxylate/amino acid:cation symporter, partial [Longimicrobiales bacterium]|nr:dicarboxylate/amino acid:cation symporter [Longimicrobiales bacterium]
MSLTTRVLLGLVLGLAVGVFLAPADAGAPAIVVAWIEPVGALWVNAIRMTVIPLVVSLLLGSITSSEAKAVARIGGRAVAWFVGLVAGTSTLGGLAAPPLLRLFKADQVQIPEFATAGTATDVVLPPFRDWLVGLLPPNPVGAAAEGAILPLVMFTVIFGVAATR